MHDLWLLLVFAVAAGLTLLLTPLVQRAAVRFDLLDVPGHVKHIHRQPVPRIGGLAIWAGFTAAALLSLVLPIPHAGDEWQRVAALLIGAAVACAFGLRDDIRPLGPYPQLLAQTIVAGIATFYGGMLVDVVKNPFGLPLELPPAVAYVFTFFWIVGMMNTINWVDGLDGLACGVVAIGSLILAIRAYSLDQLSIAALALALGGASLAFLRFNFHPASIFMGSAGTYPLGFALAVLSFIGGAKLATALLVVGVPILDVAWVIVQRVRSGASPFGGDRRHLHHRLFDLGWSQRRIVLLVYALCALFGALALLPFDERQRLVALVVMGALTFGLLLTLAVRGEPGTRSHEDTKTRSGTG